MNSLDLQKLKEKKTEIIKAEIGALLFNLGKTHAGFGHWKDKLRVDEDTFEKEYGYPVFNGYKNYYKKYNDDKDVTLIRFKEDLKCINKDFWKFFYETNVELEEHLLLSDIVYCDAIEETRPKSVREFVENMLFHGCENINSGIDKGTPKEKLENLRISNAFGSFKEEVKMDMLDRRRLYLLESLWKKISDMKLGDLTHEDWVELRSFIFHEVKNWYSHILSDSRFPVNDVTLWDQAYMTASLFKASLAAVQLDASKLKSYTDKIECRKIKWCILGIQYDKLGLAEKALRAQFIGWYRNAADETDKKVKKIIETKYTLGNEIYRDETGIYFIIPENVGDITDTDDYIFPLNASLIEIKDEVLKAFSTIFNGEVYPAIFVTKPSRGTMNIAYLLEKSKENFLKASYPTDFKEICRRIEETKNNAEDGKKPNYNGLCQICNFRLARKSNEDLMICDECDGRKHNRIETWTEDVNGETIWTGDLQDENGRIALVTLKFELQRWLNGDLLNTSIINDVKYDKYFVWLKNTLLTIKGIKEIRADEYKEYEKFKGNETALKEYVRKVNRVLGCYPNITRMINENNVNRLLNNNMKFQKYIKSFEFKVFIELAKEAYGPYMSRKNMDLTYEDFLAEVLLERTIGDRWEAFIKSKLKGNVDFDNGKIIWDKLDNNDIEFLAQILLQFLLRKNPSPARFRRIWETTQGFFDECNKELKDLLGIKDWRCKRLVWHNAIDKQEQMNREYSYKGLDFWANKRGDVYLISSIEQAIPIIAKEKIEEMENKINVGNTDWIDDISLQDYYTGQNVGIKLNSMNVAYKSYPPYISIINPTPVSWQFIVPAQYIPDCIANIQNKYYKEFKYVVGKLPLHIGVIIQDYRKPLYMGIKALRKIRRDINDWSNIQIKEKAATIEQIQKKVLQHESNSEKNPIVYEETENPTKYYSLYPTTDEKGKYQFYISPEDKKSKLYEVNFNSSSCDADIIIYPNTIDFEFMNVNSRRNDIYYSDGKRVIEGKINRPYTWEEWKLFNNFAEYFNDKDKDKIIKLHQIINVIYSKLNDWRDSEGSIRDFMLSAFINILDLKDNKGSKEKDRFAKVLLVPKYEDGENVIKWEDIKDIPQHEFKRSLLRFVDMYEFWHTALKRM